MTDSRRGSISLKAKWIICTARASRNLSLRKKAISCSSLPVCRISTKDLSFDHDAQELTDSQAEEEPALEDTTTEDLALSSAKDIETDSLPSDQEESHPDVHLLQTILKAAKGFRNINKRLHKIAETRLDLSHEDSPADAKENDSKES